MVVNPGSTGVHRKLGFPHVPMSCAVNTQKSGKSQMLVLEGKIALSVPETRVGGEICSAAEHD